MVAALLLGTAFHPKDAPAQPIPTTPLWAMTQNQNYPPGLSRWREDWGDQGALCVDWVEFEKENPGWAANCAAHGCYAVVPPPRVDACAIWLDYGYSGQSIYFYCNELRPGGPTPVYDAATGRWSCQAENRFKNAGPTCAVGNPVNPGYPNKFQVETDLVLPGEHPLRIERTYNSAGKDQGAAVGTRWRGHYFQALAPKIGLQMATVFAHRPDGRTLFFTLMKNGAAVPLTPYDAAATWQTDADTDDRLTRVADAGGTTLSWQYYVAKSDETEHYDAGGRLTAIVHRAGNTHALAYDGNGRLVTVTDTFGRQLAMSYDTAGRVATIADPAGQVYQYAHDATGNLTAVTFPGGGTRTYLYNETALTGGADLPDVLTGIVDENGARFANFGYDSIRRPVLTEHAGGANRYTLSYSGTSTTITDPLGTVRTHVYTNFLGVAKPTSITQPCESCGGGTSSATSYDANGNVTSRTDFNGKKVCYAHDLTRNLETARVEGILAAETCSTVLATPPNRADVRKVTTTWHPTYRLPTTVTEPAPGGTRTTTFSYDAAGNPVQKAQVAPANDGSGTTVSRTWSWTYGSLGRMLTATDPDGRITTYGYYADNDPNPGRRGQVQTVTNALGHVTQVTAYDAAGRPASTVDPNGLATDLTYDPRGRLSNRSVGGEQSSYVYDAAGQLTGVVLPDASTLTYSYDAAHRLIRIQDGLGNRIEYTLDAAGNRMQERLYDAGGTLARTRSRAFNALNRLAQDLGAQGQSTTYGYDGNSNLTASTDPLNRTTAHSYDALNRLTQVLDPAGGTTQYGYDAGGQLAQVTDPRGLATVYTYDGLGRLIRQTSPDTGTTGSTYTAAGHLATRTDARGVTATHTVDALGRLTATVYSRSGTPSETHTYSYDTGANALGRLTQLTDPAATTTWTYTPHGRVAGKTQVGGGVSRTLTYGYHAAGQLATLTTPSGQQIGYAYLNGRVVSVTVNGTPLASGIVTTPFGPVGAWQWGNGRYTFRDYDGDGRLTRWTFRNGTDLLRSDVSFDAASRITALADPLAPARSGAYQYDALDRLTLAQQGSPVTRTWQYGYDALGNRTAAQVDAAVTTLTYAAGSQQLQQVAGGSVPGYLVGRTNVSFGYNNANRLTTITGDGVPLASYAVNGLGQRIAKTVAGVTTHFVYDEQGRLIGEYDATGQLIQETVWLDDLPLATLRPTGTGNPTPIAIHYVHADHLGTPRAVTRPGDDQLLWRWDNAEPFGNSAPDENPSGLGTFSYHLRFPGQFYDAETGLHYNYFRDYDPAIGRYSQSDPIGINGGLNTYAYVWGDPLQYSDSTGHVGQIPAVVMDRIISCALGCLTSVGMQVVTSDCCTDYCAGNQLKRPACLLKCSPTPCETVQSCLTGCIAGALIGRGPGGILGGVAAWAMNQIAKQMFGIDPCSSLGVQDPGRPNPVLPNTNLGRAP